MKNTCHDFLASTGRAGEQGGDTGLRHALGQSQQLLADGIDKDKGTFLGIGCAGLCRLRGRGSRLVRDHGVVAGQGFQGARPDFFRPFVGRQHITGTLTYGTHAQIQSVGIDTTHQRQLPWQAAQQFLHLGHQRNIVHQTNHHHARPNQHQLEFGQRAGIEQMHARQLQFDS